MGPTATGKSDIAIKLTEKFEAEIISVDSAMVYRGMDIGTAKPTQETLKAIPHHLIDICDPKEVYSAARFQDDANRLIEIILGKNKIPVLVGGTGLYFRALEKGLADLPEANYRIRNQLEEEAKEMGWSAMHKRLRDIDPQSAERLDENDPQRIQRALEVYEITGKTMSALLAEGRTREMSWPVTKILLMPEDRAKLHDNIKQRFLAMLDAGLVNEVEALFQRGDLSLHMPSMRLVGYRQVWRYLNGDSDYETMVEHAIVATRQLAKRQMTWFRSEYVANCYDPLENNLFEQICSTIESSANVEQM